MMPPVGGPRGEAINAGQSRVQLVPGANPAPATLPAASRSAPPPPSSMTTATQHVACLAQAAGAMERAPPEVQGVVSSFTTPELKQINYMPKNYSQFMQSLRRISELPVHNRAEIQKATALLWYVAQERMIALRPNDIFERCASVYDAHRPQDMQYMPVVKKLAQNLGCKDVKEFIRSMGQAPIQSKHGHSIGEVVFVPTIALASMAKECAANPAGLSTIKDKYISLLQSNPAGVATYMQEFLVESLKAGIPMESLSWMFGDDMQARVQNRELKENLNVNKNFCAALESIRREPENLARHATLFIESVYVTTQDAARASFMGELLLHTALQGIDSGRQAQMCKQWATLRADPRNQVSFLANLIYLNALLKTEKMPLTAMQELEQSLANLKAQLNLNLASAIVDDDQRFDEDRNLHSAQLAITFSFHELEIHCQRELGATLEVPPEFLQATYLIAGSPVMSRALARLAKLYQAYGVNFDFRDLHPDVQNAVKDFAVERSGKSLNEQIANTQMKIAPQLPPKTAQERLISACVSHNLEKAYRIIKEGINVDGATLQAAQAASPEIRRLMAAHGQNEEMLQRILPQLMGAANNRERLESVIQAAVVEVATLYESCKAELGEDLARTIEGDFWNKLTAGIRPHELSENVKSIIRQKNEDRFVRETVTELLDTIGKKWDITNYCAYWLENYSPELVERLFRSALKEASVRSINIRPVLSEMQAAADRKANAALNQKFIQNAQLLKSILDEPRRQFIVTKAGDFLAANFGKILTAEQLDAAFKELERSIPEIYRQEMFNEIKRVISVGTYILNDKSVDFTDSSHLERLSMEMTELVFRSVCKAARLKGKSVTESFRKLQVASEQKAAPKAALLGCIIDQHARIKKLAEELTKHRGQMLSDGALKEKILNDHAANLMTFLPVWRAKLQPQKAHELLEELLAEITQVSQTPQFLDSYRTRLLK
jgi:hypothetical protein